MDVLLGEPEDTRGDERLEDSGELDLVPAHDRKLDQMFSADELFEQLRRLSARFTFKEDSKERTEHLAAMKELHDALEDLRVRASRGEPVSKDYDALITNERAERLGFLTENPERNFRGMLDSYVGTRLRTLSLANQPEIQHPEESAPETAIASPQVTEIYSERDLEGDVAKFFRGFHFENGSAAHTEHLAAKEGFVNQLREIRQLASQGELVQERFEALVSEELALRLGFMGSNAEELFRNRLFSIIGPKIEQLSRANRPEEVTLDQSEPAAAVSTEQDVPVRREIFSAIDLQRATAVLSKRFYFRAGDPGKESHDAAMGELSIALEQIRAEAANGTDFRRQYEALITDDIATRLGIRTDNPRASLRSLLREPVEKNLQRLYKASRPEEAPTPEPRTEQRPLRDQFLYTVDQVLSRFRESDEFTTDQVLAREDFKDRIEEIFRQDISREEMSGQLAELLDDNELLTKMGLDRHLQENFRGELPGFLESFLPEEVATVVEIEVAYSQRPEPTSLSDLDERITELFEQIDRRDESSDIGEARAQLRSDVARLWENAGEPSSNVRDGIFAILSNRNLAAIGLERGSFSRFRRAFREEIGDPLLLRETQVREARAPADDQAATSTDQRQSLTLRDRISSVINGAQPGSDITAQSARDALVAAVSGLMAVAVNDKNFNRDEFRRLVDGAPARLGLTNDEAAEKLRRDLLEFEGEIAALTGTNGEESAQPIADPDPDSEADLVTAADDLGAEGDPAGAEDDLVEADLTEDLDLDDPFGEDPDLEGDGFAGADADADPSWEDEIDLDEVEPVDTVVPTDEISVRAHAQEVLDLLYDYSIDQELFEQNEQVFIEAFSSLQALAEGGIFNQENFDQIVTNAVIALGLENYDEYARSLFNEISETLLELAGEDPVEVTELDLGDPVSFGRERVRAAIENVISAPEFAPSTGVSDEHRESRRLFSEWVKSVRDGAQLKIPVNEDDVAFFLEDENLIYMGIAEAQRQAFRDRVESEILQPMREMARS
ncbi:MAG: hypothetical protein KDD53_02710 [Bdellovibrionales bacterium]|nr:hypothetical protein [Bdellovibrionales bacterium]